MKISERKKIVHSKEDVLDPEEISILLKEAGKQLRDEFLVKAVLYGGLRAGEIAHMDVSWYVPEKKIVVIPTEKDCACRECRLRQFSIDNHKRWKKDFPDKKFSVARLEQTIRDNIQYKKDFDQVTVGKWEPKTYAGIREIPIVYDEFDDVLKRFFTRYGEVGITRVRVWQIITDVADRCGVRTTKRDVYPHCIRATCASLWGMKNVSPATMCKVFGWDNIGSANPYITTDKERANQELTDKAGDKLW